MFTKETVIILGAGASCHYGFPTGEGLIDRIIHSIKKVKLTSTGKIKKPGFFTDANTLFDIPVYKELCEKLEYYDPLSIDDFLSQFTMQKEIVDAGKTMIAYEILQSENANLLQRFESAKAKKSQEICRNENWYRYLLHALISNATSEQLGNNYLSLKIITFNYDISLEYALYSRFMNAPKFNQTAAPFLQRISDNILHMYGQVGKFRWKGHDGDRNDDDYGHYKDLNALKMATKWKDSIFVIGEDRGRAEANAKQAKEWLNKAENIFFLGFGFNDDNVKLLGLPQSAHGAHRFFCTNYDGSPEGTRIVNQKINAYFNRHALQKSVNISPKTVYRALVGDFVLND